MVRSSFALWVFAAVLPAGCTSTTCGPGTKLMQTAKGDVRCVVADGVANGNVTCDVDGGLSEIVGGVCQPRVMCDPSSTTFDPTTGLCLGKAGTGSSCPPCGVPAAGQICVTGGIVDFETGMHVMAGGRPLRIRAFEPLSFLANPSATPLAEDPLTTNGCFTFDMPVPGTGLVAIAVSDPAAGAPAGMMPLAIGGTGATVVSGTAYHVDAVTATQQRLADWSTQGGESFTASGALVGCFYNDPPQGPTSALINETMPVSGAKLLINQSQPPTVRYLDATRAINPTLTATGSLGCAVAPGDGNIDTITGQGGPGTAPMVAKFESWPGSTTANLLFLVRFHNCANAPAGTAACQ